MISKNARRLRYACLAAVSAGAVAAVGLAVPSPALRNLTLPLGGGAQLHVGAAWTGASLIGAALAQGTESVTLENVTLDLGFVTYRAPKIAFSGVSLSRPELAALFDTTATEPLAPRLARLSAKEIVVPELVAEQRGPELRSTVRYRNVAARDVVQGRMAALTADGATMEVAGKEGPGSGTIGRMSLNDLDLAEMSRVFVEKGAAEAPLRRIYGSFSIENFAISVAKGGQARIARVAGRDFMARPTRDSWPETMKALGSLETGDKASPSEKSRALKLTLDLLDAFEVGAMEVTGLDIRDPGPDKAAGRIARIAYSGARAGQPSEARAEGMDFSGPDGRIGIATIAFTGFSFASTLEGLRSIADKPIESLDPVQARKLIPAIGTIRFSGLDIDVPDKEPKGLKPDNLRFGIREVEVTADKPLNGLPTNWRLGVDGVAFSVPEGAKQDGLRELSELGYRHVDVSSTVAASWNEPGNELVVREVSLRGAGMGSVMLRGTLGNVTKDVFSPDTTLAMISLVGATAKTLDLTLENRGLVDKLLAMQGKEQGKSAEDLRREYGMAAAVGIPALLGNSAAAKTLGQAVARFIAKPGRLSISAQTKDPAGLGLADLASISEPGSILGKLELTASAE